MNCQNGHLHSFNEKYEIGIFFKCPKVVIDAVANFFFVLEGSRTNELEQNQNNR